MKIKRARCPDRRGYGYALLQILGGRWYRAGLAPADLADLLAARPRDIAPALADLEDRGMIARHLDRPGLYVITDRGQEIYDANPYDPSATL